MEPIDERFQSRAEINQSGPIQVAGCDCHGCEGPSSLDSEICRHCVFGGLGGEEEVERVVLKRSHRHIYPTPEVSKLAKTLAALRTTIWDRSSYAPEEEKSKCDSCIERRMEKMKEIWPSLLDPPRSFRAGRNS